MANPDIEIINGGWGIDRTPREIPEGCIPVPRWAIEKMEELAAQGNLWNPEPRRG